MSIDFSTLTTAGTSPAALYEDLATKKKEGGGGVRVVVVGGNSHGKSASIRRALIGRASGSGAMCAVLLTRRGVHADQFLTGQVIVCMPAPAVGPEDLIYAEVAPSAVPLASMKRPAFARA